MGQANFESLIERYADEREICNCGEAYLSNCGHGSKGGIERTDLPTCRSGCGANQISAKYYIAGRVMEELEARQIDKPAADYIAIEMAKEGEDE